jgi:FkbM family methyltransferase
MEKKLNRDELAVELEKAALQTFWGDRTGAFIEAGANHPVDGSQSYPLAQRGWTGILVEPQQKFHAQLRAQRPEAFIVRAACTATDTGGMLTLHIPSHDGLATLVPNQDEPDVVYDSVETVPTRTLDSIVEEWRRVTGSTVPIRLLALDVEGFELEVLKGFTLSIHQPDLVLIEDKLTNLTKHRYLRSQGYKLVRRTSVNNWYIPQTHPAPHRSLGEIVRLYNKVFWGLPFRQMRRRRQRARLVKK